MLNDIRTVCVYDSGKTKENKYFAGKQWKSRLREERKNDMEKAFEWMA